MNYSIGIDVSKGKSTVAIMDASEKLQEKVFEIQHNQRGVELLKEHLNKYIAGEVRIVMEADSGLYATTVSPPFRYSSVKFLASLLYLNPNTINPFLVNFAFTLGNSVKINCFAATVIMLHPD